MSWAVEPRFYSVSRRHKAPLVDFIRSSLETAGCRILHEPDPAKAPYRFTFETPVGERLGILVYAFFATRAREKNSRLDAYSFQAKYPETADDLHEFWQDPYLLYTTLFCGIDLQRGIFVGADSVLSRGGALPVTIRYRESSVARINRLGWSAWEYRSRGGPIEILVGGVSRHFLRYVMYERAALGEDPGHRHLIAERYSPSLALRAGVAAKDETELIQSDCRR